MKIKNTQYMDLGFQLHVSSPGRINFIGEHTDYNDGFVLPAAIDKCIHLKLKPNGTEHLCTVKSEGFEGVLELDLNQLTARKEAWHNFILGVLHELQLIAPGVKGFDCEISSEIPIGSGVSSSAALECGLAFGLNELFDLGLDREQLARLSQRAEHNFVGTECGIMDQFSSLMGRAGHALLLDCKSMELEYVPVQLEPHVILILNTNVTHDLAISGYNTRRNESATGLKVINEHFGTKNSYREITMEMVEACKKELGSTLFKRCTYILEENERVLKAAACLRRNDINGLGKLLYESHEGQRNLYEISCAELDFLVDYSKNELGILGARMMGGGFGGCTLNIIHKDKVKHYLEHVSVAYQKEFNIELSHFITTPSDGTRLIPYKP